jgi:hypothetical protein
MSSKINLPQRPYLLLQRYKKNWNMISKGHSISRKQPKICCACDHSVDLKLYGYGSVIKLYNMGDKLLFGHGINFEVLIL